VERQFCGQTQKIHPPWWRPPTAATTPPGSRAPEGRAAALPAIQLVVNQEQKTKAKSGPEEVKWAVVPTQQGGNHAVLLINDATENLGRYLSVKEAKFGKSCFVVFCSCCNKSLHAVNVSLIFADTSL